MLKKSLRVCNRVLPCWENVIIESGSNNQPIQEGSAWKMRRQFLVELQIEMNIYVQPTDTFRRN